jgi:hypothetical protein
VKKHERKGIKEEWTIRRKYDRKRETEYYLVQPEGFKIKRKGKELTTRRVN